MNVHVPATGTLLDTGRRSASVSYQGHGAQLGGGAASTPLTAQNVSAKNTAMTILFNIRDFLLVN